MVCRHCGAAIYPSGEVWFHFPDGWMKCFNQWSQVHHKEIDELRGFDAEPVADEEIIDRVLKKYHEV